jgi:hypothetical protein
MTAKPSPPSAVALVARCDLGGTTIRRPSPSLARFLRSTLEPEPGFLELLGCVEESTGTLVCITLWSTEQDALRFEALSRSTIEELRWILEAGPQSRIYDRHILIDG